MSDRGPTGDATADSTTLRLDLGKVDPCGSRQAGRRSGVALTENGPVAGLADRGVRAFDFEGRQRWNAEGDGSAITLVPFGDGVLVGERSARGGIRLLADGQERWRHDAADEVGRPTKETRFFLPMVVAAAVAGETAYVAARRYERRDGQRHFESSVYALAADGTVRWRYDADASPVSLAAFDGGVAVAYNRCPGVHDDGLVVLDGEGEPRWAWDPDRGASRRVGDVAATDGDLVVTSHADYRGYRLAGGDVVWRADLGTPSPNRNGVYTYPNHVHADGSGIVFVTGNTFPREGRETDERHPKEQSAFGYTPDGRRRWRADVGGFSHEIATDGDRLLVPVAQHFRDRDPAVHGFRLFDVSDGLLESASAAGVHTAAALDGDRSALIEEPVEYHDDGTVRGEYALLVARR
jgi:outer membrane protein assembly factor BamB